MLTEAGDVVAVATPGHTADHLSIVADDGDTTYFLAGDASYDEKLMLAGKLDGVSADERVTTATLDAIRNFVQSRPTVYLPTDDPQAAARLARRQLAGRRSLDLLQLLPALTVWPRWSRASGRGRT